MKARRIDIAIVGGGLAGGLIALAIHRARPELHIALVEADDRLGGNHRWSWFDCDLQPEGDALMAPFPKTSWTSGNSVRFPTFERHLRAGYRSLASTDFDATLRECLPEDAILTGVRAVTLSATGLDSQEHGRIEAEAVIDCRNPAPTSHLQGGWQVFLGRHIRTAAPHGIAEPVIMDARVDQPGAYRFVYLLPLAPDEIFVEDTYYADRPDLDRAALGQRIDAYCASRGWEGRTIAEETGILPVITGGDFGAFRAQFANPGVALAGARGGFTHPLTSYTMPIAVENALAIADHAHLPGAELARFVEQRAKQHWNATGFYRLLGKMLFDAAEPEDRYRVFQRFYGLSEPLIERFYAARSTFPDKLRILAGRPPVPVGRAMAALLGKGAPLVQGTGQ